MFVDAIKYAIHKQETPTGGWLAEFLQEPDYAYKMDAWQTKTRIVLMEAAGYEKVNGRWRPPVRDYIDVAR